MISWNVVFFFFLRSFSPSDIVALSSALLSAKPPKGFEKYFKKGDSKVVSKLYHLLSVRGGSVLSPVWVLEVAVSRLLLGC